MIDDRIKLLQEQVFELIDWNKNFAEKVFKKLEEIECRLEYHIDQIMHDI